MPIFKTNEFIWLLQHPGNNIIVAGKGVQHAFYYAHIGRPAQKVYHFCVSKLRGSRPRFSSVFVEAKHARLSIFERWEDDHHINNADCKERSESFYIVLSFHQQSIRQSISSIVLSADLIYKSDAGKGVNLKHLRKNCYCVAHIQLDRKLFIIYYLFFILNETFSQRLHYQLRNFSSRRRFLSFFHNFALLILLHLLLELIFFVIR